MYARDPATHVCPAAAKIPASTPASACSRFASSNTMLGLLPPSSSMQLTRRWPARAAIARAAGERHFRDQRMIDERFACLAEPADDVDDAGRDAGGFGEARELD